MVRIIAGYRESLLLIEMAIPGDLPVHPNWEAFQSSG
jgi:hypothetical protein